MDELRKAVGTASAVVAFEAAGRHLNFTRAAEELNVTQPAISRQIRNLEHHIGCRLFRRRGNKVGLTPEGLTLFNAATTSFRHIVSAVEQISPNGGGDTLVLRSEPTILSTVVLPMYSDLIANFPDIPIDMRAMKNSAPLERDRPSVSILFGKGDWPDLESELLLDEICVPICHPSLLDGLEDTSPETVFAELPLLQVSSYVDAWMDWQTWGAHFAIEDLSRKRPQLINDYDMLMQACFSGHGVAVGSFNLLGQSLMDGALVRATDLHIRSEYGFYLVYDRELAADEAYARFLKWIRRSAAKTRRKYLPMLREIEAGAAG